jgi:hypothetical protein
MEIFLFNGPRIPPKRKQTVGLSYRRAKTTCDGVRQFLQLFPVQAPVLRNFVESQDVILGRKGDNMRFQTICLQTICVFKQYVSSKNMSSNNVSSKNVFKQYVSSKNMSSNNMSSNQ